MAVSVPLQNNVFLDASYIIALSTPNDNYHAVAIELSHLIANRRPTIVTSRGVLLEIGNSLSKLQHRATGLGILTALNNDPRIQILDVTASLYGDALSLFSSRPDKEWGMTDCLSFTIMEHRGIQQALTADEHFIQAGYQALMRL